MLKIRLTVEACTSIELYMSQITEPKIHLRRDFQYFNIFDGSHPGITRFTIPNGVPIWRIWRKEESESNFWDFASSPEGVVVSCSFSWLSVVIKRLILPFEITLFSTIINVYYSNSTWTWSDTKANLFLFDELIIKWDMFSIIIYFNPLPFFPALILNLANLYKMEENILRFLLS